MRIAVLVKQIPDPEQLRLINGRVVREGVDLTVNAYCRRANAKAVELAGSEGEVVLFTMGPPSAEDALREMIACGASRGVHLCDPILAGSDTLATATALAVAVQKEGPFDLVLAGLNSLDSDTGQVPAEVAELLGLPFAAGVRDLEVGGLEVGASKAGKSNGGVGEFEARLETDNGYCSVVGELPAVLSTAERLCYPSKAPPEKIGKVDASRISRLAAADLGIGLHRLGTAGSPTSVGPVRVFETSRHPKVTTDISEAVDLLVGLGILSAAGEVNDTGDSLGQDSLMGPVGGSAVGEVNDDRKSGDHRFDDRESGDHKQVWCFFTELDIGVELLYAAAGLADDIGGSVTAITTEPVCNIDDMLTHFESNSVDRVLVVPTVFPGKRLEISEQADALAAVVAVELPWVLLIEGTRSGRSVASFVAARHGWGLIGDAVGLEVTADERLVAWKPAFNGRLEAPIRSASSVQMATVRPGALLKRSSQSSDRRVYPAAGVARTRQGSERQGSDVVRAVEEHESSYPFKLQMLPVPPSAKIRTIAIQQDDRGVSELRRAQVVVAVGQGIDPSGYPVIDELRSVLGGAALGATRKVTDQGWISRGHQIGVTGHHVAPRLLVSVGASGRFNHTVGIRNSRTILAINTDRDAEICDQADIAIVGDWRQIIPELVAELETRRLTVR